MTSTWLKQKGVGGYKRRLESNIRARAYKVSWIMLRSFPFNLRAMKSQREL